MRGSLPVLLALTSILTPIPGPGLAAQSAPHPTTLPKPFTGARAPGVNALPLARSRGFVQFWHRGDDLGPAPRTITRLGWRPDEETVERAQLQVLEIVLSSTAAGFHGLDPRFANNLGADRAVFLAVRTVSLPPQNRPSDPDAPAVWIPGDRPFAWRGPHFLVQVDILTTSIPLATAYGVDGWKQILPNETVHVTSDRSCGGTLTSGWAGGTLTLRLRGAAPGQPASFWLGIEHTRFGAIPLPFRLDALGMPGCLLAVDPVWVVPVVADGAGAHDLALPAALPVVTFALHAQALHAAPSAPLGLATTNAAHALLGTEGVSNYLYNWTVQGPVAEFGPYPANVGPVLLID